MEAVIGDDEEFVTETRPLEPPSTTVFDSPEIGKMLTGLCQYALTGAGCLIKLSRGEKDTACDYSFIHNIEQGVGWTSYNPKEAANCKLLESRKRLEDDLRGTKD